MRQNFCFFLSSRDTYLNVLNVVVNVLMARVVIP